METNACILGRRSIRRYENRPIPRKTIEELISLASYAPSWKNTQVSRYTVVTDRALIDRIAEECVLGFAHNAGILRGCAALVIQSVRGLRSGYNRDGSFSTTKGSHWESFDAGIAAQTLCLAAWDRGIGTCILGVFDENKAAEVIQLPEGQSVACMIPMGYPAEAPAAPARKGADELITWLA